MKRNMGMIIILVGVGALFISNFFSSGYSKYDIHDGHRRTIMENIYQMKIVLRGAEMKATPKVLTKIEFKDSLEGDDNISLFKFHVKKKEIAIPLKYMLAFSVVLILIGTGILLFKRHQ